MGELWEMLKLVPTPMNRPCRLGRPEPDLLLWDCNKSLGDIPRILYDHNLRHNWHILYYIPFQMRSILVPKMKTKTLSELILINVLMTYLQIDIQTYVYL